MFCLFQKLLRGPPAALGFGREYFHLSARSSVIVVMIPLLEPVYVY